MSAGNWGKLAVVWIVDMVVILVLFRKVRQHDQQTDADHQHFWDKMQEHFDGTHPSQEDKR